MIRIMLACAGGMSTSLLMNKMKEEADNRGLEVSVEAIGEKTLEQHLGEFDVLLLGPNVKKILAGKIPFDVIDMRDYGLMNGEKVLAAALKMYDDFYNK